MPQYCCKDSRNAHCSVLTSCRGVAVVILVILVNPELGASASFYSPGFASSVLLCVKPSGPSLPSAMKLPKIPIYLQTPSFLLLSDFSSFHLLAIAERPSSPPSCRRRFHHGKREDQAPSIDVALRAGL